MGKRAVIDRPATRVHVLGPFELRVGGELADVSRLQVRRVLALLASARRYPVSADRIVEHLWSSRPPSDPRASLRVVLTRVRSSLGVSSDMLQSQGGLHVLVAGSDLDDVLTVADRLTAAGRTSDEALSADELVDALTMWRGLPFVGLGDNELLAEMAQELEAAHRRLVEGASRALVGEGRDAEASHIALSALRDDPTSEQLASVAANALARLGRRGEALLVLDTTRTALRVQLGMDPGVQFSSTERSILRGGVDITSRVEPARVSHAPAGFVGRTDLLSKLCADRDPGLFVVSGEPGSGKSRLLVEMSSRISVPALFAPSTPTPQRPMEALTHLLLELVAAVPESLEDEAMQALLVRLAPETLASRSEIAAPQTRDALLSQAVAVLNRWAAADRCVLLFDDCQWLDRASATVLEHLTSDRQCRIVASRRPRLPESVAFLADDALTSEQFELGALRLEDVAEIIERQLGDTSPVTATEVHTRAGGNALFTTLLISMVAEGVETTQELPPSILVAVQRRLAALSDSCQQALRCASVFTGPIELELVDQLYPDGARHLVPAVDVGLLVKAGEGSLGFSHQLVAEAVYQLLPEGHRLQLHDELGRLLEESGASHARYAIHCREAAAIDPLRAVTSHVGAAREFREAFVWDTCLLYLDEALRLIESRAMDLPRELAEILVLQGAAARAIGRADSDDLLIAGARAAHDNGWSALALDALVELCSHGRISENGKVGREILDLVRDVLSWTLTDHQRAELASAASTLLNGSTMGIEGMGHFRTAFEIAERIGDPELDAKVLLRLDLGMGHPDDFDSRRQGALRLKEIAGSDPDLLWEAAFLEFGHAQALGDDQAVNLSIEAMRELTPLVRMRNRDFGLAFGEAAFSRYYGDFERASHLTDHAAEVGRRRYTASWVENVCGVLQISLLQVQGRLSLLGPLVDRHLAGDEVKPYWYALATEVAAESGDLDRVESALDLLRQHEYAMLVPDIGWTAKLTTLAPAVSLLNDRRSAEFLHNALFPFRGRNSWSGVCIHRPVDEALVLLDDVLSSTVEPERG